MRLHIKFPGRPVNGQHYAPILQSWQHGFNTAQIAHALKIAESDVARVIAADQDRRYREWTDAAPAVARAAQ